MNIFFSYGHGDYHSFIDIFIQDLKDNHEVWIDRELRLGDNWAPKIDNAIMSCDLFLFVKSKSSVRADSYCYGEITFAREQHKTIVVVSLDDEPTPSIISNVQRFDMSSAINILGEIDDDGYEVAFEKLRRELDRFQVVSTAGGGKFRLFSFGNRHLTELQNDLLAFPDQIIQRIERWNRSKSTYFGVFGNAASGKSTLCAALSARIPQAVTHFFRYSDLKSLDARWYLQHIISSLADRNEAFRTELNKENFEADIFELKPEQLIVDFLIEPLRRANERALIILDGFDEIANKTKRKEASELFFGETFRENNYGDSVKVLVTSRNDRELKSLLASTGAEIISDFEKENNSIIRQIVERFLEENRFEYSEGVFEKIYLQSGGDFLYIKFILDELKSSGLNDLTQIRFPLGMKGVCQMYFDRIFDDEDFFEDVVAPVLEVIVSVKTPISVDELQKICHTDRRELRKLLKKLEMFLDVRDNRIIFVHKSLYDWLVSNEIMDKYYIDCNEGQKKLCLYSLSELNKVSPSVYACEYGLHHIAEANRYEEIAEIMCSHEHAFSSIFTAFAIELIAEEAFSMLCDIFRVYASVAAESEFLTAETLKNLVRFGREAVAEKIAAFFQNEQIKHYYQKWIAFHIAKRNNESTSKLHSIAGLLLTQTKDPIIAANLKKTLGDIIREQGNYDEAKALYESVLSIAEENNLSGIFLDCEYALIDLLFVRGELKAAWSKLNGLKDEPLSKSSQLANYQYHRLRGHLFHIEGDLAGAFNEHNESFRIAQDLHYALKQMQSANSCAEAAADYNTGSTYLTISRAFFLEKGLNRLEYGKSYYIESELLINEQRYSEAEVAAGKSLSILSEVGYAGGTAHAHLERGKARYFLSKQTDAIKDLCTALDYYREKQTRPRFRFEAYAYLLLAAEKAGRLQEFFEKDDLAYYVDEDYPCLAELYSFVIKKRKDLLV